MEEELHPPQDREDPPDAGLPQVENTLLSALRRTVTETGASQLTLTEAAALFGSSMENMRRRIKAGTVRTFRDRRGRLRVNASVTYEAADEGVEAEEADSETVARLWEELKQARARIEEMEAENSRLQNELQATENALEYTKAEVANLWRAMTTRNVRQARTDYAPPPTMSESKVLDFAQERSRIQGKIADVRNLARRKKFPWVQTG